MRIIFSYLFFWLWFFSVSVNALSQDFVQAINEKDSEAILDQIATANAKTKKELVLEASRHQFSRETLKLRRYLLKELEAYLNSEPANNSIKTYLNHHLKSDFEYLVNSRYHSTEEIEQIVKNLALIEKFKLTEFFYEVITYISYPMAKVREQAYKTLALLNDDRMFPIILKMATSENKLNKIYALDALYYIKDDRTVPLLIKLLGDENKSVRIYAIRTLENMNKNEAIPYVSKLAQKDINNEVRVRAIQMLGEFHPHNAYYVVANTISDDHRDVRSASIDALLMYNNNQSAYYISRQLVNETEEDLQLKEIKALIKLNSYGNTAGLKAIIEKEEHHANVIWATYAAGVLEDRYSYDLIKKNTTHSNIEIRTESIAALGKYQKDQDSLALLKIIEQEDEELIVQNAALNAVKSIAYGKSLPGLYAVSKKHPNKNLRIQIQDVIGHIINREY